MRSKLILSGVLTCSLIALAGCSNVSDLVSNLGKPTQTTPAAVSSSTPVTSNSEPADVFSGEPSAILLSKNYLPKSNKESSEMVEGTVESDKVVYQESEQVYTEDDSGYFEMTWDFDGFFAVQERYQYESGEFQKCNTYVIPGKLDSLDEIVNFTLGFFEREQFTYETANGYEYIWNKSLLFPDIATLSQERAYNLAKAEKERIDRLAEEEAVVAPVTKPFILSVSENTLKMSKYTMRVQVGETKQICIAECPKGYEDKLIFMTDNKSAAVVDENGNVTGIKSGSATITVTVDGAAGYSSVMIYVY